MAMKKMFLSLTSYLEKTPVAGLYKMIFDEYQRTEKYLLKLTRHISLMEDYPADALS